MAVWILLFVGLLVVAVMGATVAETWPDLVARVPADSRAGRLLRRDAPMSDAQWLRRWARAMSRRLVADAERTAMTVVLPNRLDSTVPAPRLAVARRHLDRVQAELNTFREQLVERNDDMADSGPIAVAVLPADELPVNGFGFVFGYDMPDAAEAPSPIEAPGLRLVPPQDNTENVTPTVTVTVTDATVRVRYRLAADGASVVVGEGDEVTVGRSRRCELVVTNRYVGRAHLKAGVRGGDLHVTDLGSKNGTRIGGRVVKESTTVSGDTTIALGPEVRISVRKLGVAG